MPLLIPDKDSEDWDDDGWPDDKWFSDPCSSCGPECQYWGGDGLCELALERLASETEDYQQNFVVPGVACPVCGVELTQYEIPTDELWIWPGDFYSPTIALNIYAVLDAPKGLLHSSGKFHHIYTGSYDKNKEEKLIFLSGKEGPVDDNFPF